MMRCMKIGEAKTHRSAPLPEAEAGDDLVICRGTTQAARVTRISAKGERAELSATLRRERRRSREKAQNTRFTICLKWA